MASSPTAAGPLAPTASTPLTSRATEARLEADPVLFAWRSARLQHSLAAALAIGLGLPLVWLDLLIVRDVIAVLFAPGGGPASLLSLGLDLPPRLGGHHVLFGGWSVPRAQFGLVALPLLVGIGALAAACGWGVARLAFEAETRAVRRLREIATDAILVTSNAARDDARSLATLVGDALRASEGWLAGAVLLPALALGCGLLSLGAAIAVQPELAFVLVAALASVGLLRRSLLIRRATGAQLRRGEGAGLEIALSDLVRRLPAIRAHGTKVYERGRLTTDARARRRVLAAALSSVGRTRALTIALAGVLTALLFGSLLPPAAPGPVAPGPFAAALCAFAIAARAVSALARARASLKVAGPLFARASEAVTAIERRQAAWRRSPGGTALAANGEIVLSGAAAYDPVSGERLNPVNLSWRMPGHVAVVGRWGSGTRALASLVTGQIAPTMGRASYGGQDLARIDGSVRAGRIAVASGDAVLIAGTLLDNLLYGCPEAPSGALLEERLGKALTVTGLDRLVYARGLAGTIDPAREPVVAPALLETRAALRTILAEEGAAHLIEPFRPDRYNRHATIGENILFGVPVGDHFAAADLAGRPFMQAILEAERLTRPLCELGLAVARSTAEIFADLPNDHPLFDAFSLFPAARRGFFEDLVGRQQEALTLRRGPAGNRDRDGLIGLALRYNETRHRFGLVDEALEARVVAARRSFARLLPRSLADTIEFYDPARLTAAASLQDNLLFGRIAHDEAGADERVRSVLRRVLAERGLERLVYRIGLTDTVDLRSTGKTVSLTGAAYDPAERAGIELARCLMRDPDILVVGPRGDGASVDIGRLRAARAGRGLIVFLDGDAALGEADYDGVWRVERGEVKQAWRID